MDYGREIINCITDAEVLGNEHVGGILGASWPDLIGDWPFIGDCLYIGKSVKSSTENTWGAVIGLTDPTNAKVFNSYYTDKSFDNLVQIKQNLRGYPITVGTEGITVTVVGDLKGVEYEGKRYIPKKGAKIHVEEESIFKKINYVKVNGNLVGSDAGTYDVNLDDYANQVIVTCGLTDRTLSGSGTEADPYAISTMKDWNFFVANLQQGATNWNENTYFCQKVNITLDKTISNNFTPVKTFKGHYDGAGYTISGLNIDLSKDNLSRAALFGTLEGSATVKNVIVQNSTIIGASAAAVAGYVSGTSRVENCHALKDVVIDAAYWYAGGIVAYTNDGTPTIASCTSQASVHTFDNYAGGVIGRHDNGSATGCIYLGNSITHTKGTSYAHAVIGGGGQPTDCYFTDPTLTDDKAKLMPQYNKDIDNTDFLTRLAARDKFVMQTSGLTREQIGYDITLNNRTTLAAVQNADGTWQSKAFSVCLPFEVNFRQQFGDDAVTEHVKAYMAHRIDLDKKELIFTGVFPEIKAGEAYMIVVEKGSVSLTGKNVTIVDTPATPEKVMSAADENKQIGEWKGTFRTIGNDEMIAGNNFIAQKDHTFKCQPKGKTGCWTNPFVGYLAPLEALTSGSYLIKYVPTGQGDGDEEGEVTDFPADLYDFDYEIEGDETGISTAIRTADGNGRYYDLQGRQINNKPSKGLYIKNGKVIIVK